MPELSLKLIATEPLHHTAFRDTWIDFFLTIDCDSIKEYNRTPPSVPSRHDIITVTVDTFYSEVRNNENFSHLQKHSKNAPDKLCSTLHEGDWSDVSLSASELNVEQGIVELTNNLQDAIDMLAPERLIR